MHPGKATCRTQSRFSLRARTQVDSWADPFRLPGGRVTTAPHDLDVVAIGSPLLDVVDLTSEDGLAGTGLKRVP